MSDALPRRLPEVGLSAVIVAVTREVPRILTVRWPGAVGADQSVDDGEAGTVLYERAAQPGTSDGVDALPFGQLDPEVDHKLEPGLRRWVRERTGLALGYAEQLYTFGDRYRNPDELRGGSRRITVAYLALVPEQPLPGPPDARWRDWYDFFPWEDWRNGRPIVIESAVEPLLRRWVAAAPTREIRGARRDRSDIAFGGGGASWNMERVLERYELLYEVGGVTETHVDAALRRAAIGASAARTWLTDGEVIGLGCPMALDHRRILATALGRLRGKLRYRPVVFELLPPEFTLFQLQRVVESLAGVRLHKGNFRRLVEKGGLVEGTGRFTGTGGRPAELFRFRPGVLREHVAPGVGLPGVHG